jgi:hypothetical protein
MIFWTALPESPIKSGLKSFGLEGTQRTDVKHTRAVSLIIPEDTEHCSVTPCQEAMIG